MNLPSLRSSSMASSSTSGIWCRNGSIRSRTSLIKRQQQRRRIARTPTEANDQQRIGHLPGGLVRARRCWVLTLQGKRRDTQSTSSSTERYSRPRLSPPASFRRPLRGQPVAVTSPGAGAPLRSVDDGSNTVVMSAWNWATSYASALGLRKSFVGGFVKRKPRGPSRVAERPGTLRQLRRPLGRPRNGKPRCVLNLPPVLAKRSRANRFQSLNRTRTPRMRFQKSASPCHVGNRENIVPSQLAVQAAFLTDNWDLLSTPYCAGDAGHVHALAAGIPNVRIDDYIGLDKSRGQVTEVALDTGSVPNVV